MLILDTKSPNPSLCLQYWTSSLPGWFATNLLDVAINVVTCILKTPQLQVKHVTLLTDSDYKRISRWNTQVSTSKWQECCIHTLIHEQCVHQPSAQAVCAWDGSFTYAELDKLSSDLQALLQHQYGVGPEIIVPVCFEKSRWTTVAVLAILKAGGAFVLLDPSVPSARHLDVCKDVEAKVIVTSSQQLSLSKALAAEAIVIPKDIKTISEIHIENSKNNGAKIQPHNAAYLAFTSGSTGRPKGAVVQHGSFCSSAMSSKDFANLNNKSRVLQFASYAFDISIYENLATLMVGGCICVPSETHRVNGIHNAIADLRANWAELTPSVARLITPSTIPTIDTLLMGGESMSKTDVTTWAKKVRLMCVYGCAECSVLTTLRRVSNDSDPNPCNIGRPYSGACWIVDPDNHDQLAPVGAVGELFIGGSTVGRGYLNRLAETKSAFIKDPVWAPCSEISANTPLFYKTGDLVRYDHDGSIVYLGRKDCQVKINGQRVELAEIEYLAQEYLQLTSVVAQKISWKQNSSIMIFVAGKSFITGNTTSGYMFSPPSDEFRGLAGEIISHLRDRFPSYMVPSMCFPVTLLPLGRTGKVDRRRLAEEVASLSEDEFKSYSLTESSVNGLPRTKFEVQLQQLFCETLGLTSVSVEDGFFNLGGDSISAITLVANAHDKGLYFKVADVFTHPTIAGLVKIVEVVNSRATKLMTPFSLMPKSRVEDYIQLAADQCGVHRDEIEDILPCTKLQENLIAATGNHPNLFVGQFALHVTESLDLDQFKRALRKVVNQNSIMRTRFIQLLPGDLFQVVIHEDIEWTETLSFDKHTSSLDSRQRRLLGAPLVRFAICSEPSQAYPISVVMTIHHALFDRWSFTQLLDDFEALYYGQAVESRVPFGQFIAHCSRIDLLAAKQFWASEFESLDAVNFPRCPPDFSVPVRVAVETLHFNALKALNDVNGDYTFSTMVRLAWALVIASHTDSSDVIFGVAVTGRNAPVIGVGKIIGPTIATIPLRVNLNENSTVKGLLRSLQSRATKMIPFEQMGIQGIKRISPEAASACEFQSLLIVQSPARNNRSTLFAESLQNFEQQLQFSTHVLTVVCEPEIDSVSFRALYDSTILTRFQVQGMLHQLRYTLQQITNNPDLKREHMDTLSPFDRLQISYWNNRFAWDKPFCSHIYVLEHCFSRPNANAVCAWDGTLAYSRLYGLARELAIQLQAFKVEPERFVAICVEKSKWVPVAILGVLMAGGAFVLLDPGQPKSRLLAICREVGAIAAVLSSNQADKFVDSPIKTIDVSLRTLMNGSTTGRKWIPSPVTPYNAMYAAFTSGSTGTPKGAIIEHKAFTANLKASEIFSMNSHSRVLNFSSPAFDSSLVEIVLTLMVGGCVCIPSETERVSDLCGTINRLEVNLCLLTPSVSRLLAPKDIPSVETLILVGEPILPNDVSLWASHLSLKNGYGPSECAVVTTINPELMPNSDPSNIGHPVSCTCWVVDPNDHNKIKPIGTIGELVIGGPIVARGYINNPDANSSFVTHPTWGSRFSLELDERFYKTGDLVQQNSDGTYQFIGRKDTQAKLHGQRIELQEVEHHVQAIYAGSTVIAEVVRLGVKSNPKLAVFLCEDTPEPQEAKVHGDGETSPFLHPNDDIRMKITALKSHLSGILPSFMVPSVCLMVNSIPLTTSGKADRRLLRAKFRGLPPGFIESYSMPAASKRPPSSNEEKALQKVFAEVLSLNLHDVGVEDNFLALGGDSISVMQVVAMCRKECVGLTAADVLRNQTISRICQKLGSKLTVLPEHQPTPRMNSSFPLTPIQRMFFENAAEDSRFNQSFLMTIQIRLEFSSLRCALEAVVGHHSMLTARFKSSKDGLKTQHITNDVESSFIMRQHRVENREELASIIATSQKSLNPKTGPVFAANLIEVENEGQLLFLVAHHLVIDLTSWRIILQDLESVLSDASLPDGPDFKYQIWSELQVAHANERLTPENVLPFKVAQADYRYWGVTPGENNFSDITSQELEIDVQTTNILLTRANKPFRSKISDIIQAAILHSFANIFTDRPIPTIFNEGHGREPWDASIDLSRTVGWHTILWPCVIQSSEGLDLVELVRRVKDVRQRVPGNGMPYFASRYLNPACQEAFAGHSPMEVLFNYTGIYRQPENAIFKQVSMSSDELGDADKDMRRFALIDITASVVHGSLKILLEWNRNMLHQEEIFHWTQECKISLIHASQKLIDTEVRLTLSDFDLLPLTYDNVINFETDIMAPLGIPTIDEIEDAYPCSPMQHGIFLSGGASQKFCSIWEVQTSQGQAAVSPTFFREAWAKVVGRHCSLRAILLDCPFRPGWFNHIVLKTINTATSILRSSDEKAISTLRDHEPLDLVKGNLPYTFAICQTYTGRVLFKLEAGQAMVDASTVNIILQELSLAYRNELPPYPGPPYRSIISYIHSKDDKNSVKYWRNALYGIEPCIVPRTNLQPSGSQDMKRLCHVSKQLCVTADLQRFCESNGTTISNVFQVAWGLVLVNYTGLEDVCFGCLVSGRDTPVVEIKHMVGTCFNVLPCRLNFKDVPISKILQGNQDEIGHRLQHQYISLAEIMDLAGLPLHYNKPLFNACISIQYPPENSEASGPRNSGLSFFNLEKHEATEVSSVKNTRFPV